MPAATGCWLMSLRTRLLLLVALATLVPAVLVGVRFFQNRAAEIESALTELSMQANIVANDLDEKIQGTAQLQYGLGRAIDLDSADRAQCSAFLSAVRERYPQYTGILTITPEGNLFCDSLQTKHELDLRDRKYFQQALVTKGAVTMQPAFGRLTGISVLQIAYPARMPSGQLKYVLLASFNLQKFADFYNQRTSSGLNILLLDKDGTVLASPAGPEWAKRTGTSITDTDLFKFAGQSADANHAREVTGIDGSKQFWAAVSMPAIRDAGLYVMAGVSRDSLVAAADRRLYEDLSIVALVSLLLFAGVWTLAEIGVRRQVGRIAEMAKKLGSGDLSIRITPPYPTGELGGLMAELNAAAGSLQRQHAAIADLNKELCQSQKKEAGTKAFLDAIIEHIPNAVAVKAVPDAPFAATSMRLMLVNKAYEELTGLPRSLAIGKSAYDLYPEETADIVAASDMDALESEKAVVSRDLSLATAGNGVRLVTMSKVVIRDSDRKPQYLLTVLDDVTERRRAEKTIAHMAHYDTLTDLPNRAAFNALIAATLDRAASRGERFTILSVDLDRFKEANDAYGHATGDALLQGVAQRLQAAAGGAFIARIGGDEFILIVADGSQPEAAEKIADRLSAAFVDEFVIDGKHLQISLSVGGAVYPADGTDVKTLVVNADAALYRAKAERCESALFFQPEMGIQQQERHDLQQDLKLAIERAELLLYYQPQFRITGEVIGFEALARWHCPKRGMVSPGTFIPIAEEYGHIIPMGEWALREACREAASWRQSLKIAVNVSPIQFHHGDLPSLVHSILLETGLSPSRLELEITEGVLINDFSRAVSILCQLKGLGVQIALDDFGKGYSSLSYLHSFAFDKIKVDRAFIADLEYNHHSMAIVRAVIGLAHSLKIPVLAEGVEQQSQRAFLLQEGCDQLQGYLVGRPFPIGDYGGVAHSGDKLIGYG
jgi:diguanylate cyclase (GGDEF)-like protein/PAS domain S-box-containing protein